MTTLIIATRNRHKADEIRAILGSDFRFLTLHDFPEAPKVVEDAPTFAGNATKKAVELARWLAKIRSLKFDVRGSRFCVLADDSGLEVDALSGAPGVHSARFAASEKTSDNSSDAANCEKLLRLLKDVPPEKRTARFCCVIALDEIPGIKTELFDGACEGKIIFSPRGGRGFGYDPLFVPEGFEQTFAELGDEVKNQTSHRAKALAKLRQRLDSTKSR